MMEFALNNIVAPTILSIAVIYIWGKLLNEKVDIKSIKFWGILISMVLLGALNYWVTNKFIRIIITDILFVGFCKILFEKKLNQCIGTVLIEQMIMIAAEFTFAISVIFTINPSMDIIEKNFFGMLITDAAISIIMILGMNFKFIYNLHKAFLDWTNDIKEKYLMLGVGLLTIIVNFLIVTPYYKIEYKYAIICNTIIIFIYVFIFLNSIKNQHKLIQVSDKYNTTLSSLKEYENMLNKYKVSNHENKNQFLTVRNMLNPKNEKEKEVMDYIDEFVENKIKDDEKIMEEACIIPEGGLRGLMYSKLVYMREKKINYELNIDKKVKTSDLIAFNKEETLDVCKILGIFIDNAIEEVIDLDEKLISIDIYKEKKELCFSVTNNYHHTIDLEKIEEEGYTTKGNGHGFGLPLAKQLIEKHNNFKNLKQISENTFTQIIKIKIK